MAERESGKSPPLTPEQHGGPPAPSLKKGQPRRRTSASEARRRGSGAGAFPCGTASFPGDEPVRRSGRKRLGQHFLIDADVARRMVEAADLRATDPVLEIGPGQGHLTRHLVAAAGRVLAVELDPALARALPLRVAAPNLQVLCADILDLKLSELLEPPGWKVVANLPYYITSPILEKLLMEGAGRVEGMWLMVQKEVARRVVARGTREGGALSYFVQYYAEPRLLFTVPPQAFQPPPEVESAVLQLRPRQKPPFPASPERLFRLVRAAFGARRKTLRRSLDSLLGGRACEVLQRAGIDPTRRPETLTLEEFGALARAWDEDSQS